MSTASASDPRASGPRTPGPGTFGPLPSDPQSDPAAAGTRASSASPGAGASAPRAFERPTGSSVRRSPEQALVFSDPLDQQSADDTDSGWGERSIGGGDGDSAADLARFLDEKPPHHI